MPPRKQKADNGLIQALIDAEEGALVRMKQLVKLGRPSPTPRIIRSEIKSLKAGKPTTLKSSCAAVVLTAALFEVGRAHEARQVEAGGPYTVHPDGAVVPE